MVNELIRAKNIRKFIKERDILAIPSLTIEKGEVVGLFGPNGAGKSSLLRILALIDTDYQGELYLFGQAPKGVKRRLGLRRRTAMVLEEPIVYRGTVIDNMAIGFKFRGISNTDARQKISWALDLLKINHLRTRKASQLSRGEAQRLCLARVLALNPDLLFLDEPLNSVDSSSRKSLLTGLNQWLRREGQTSIYVSHNLAEIEQLADRIIYIADGRLQANLKC